ncbi:MAG: ATP-binding protein [Actinomycetota bacterium]
MTALTTSKHEAELLEREHDLAALAALLTDVWEEGRGALVLLAGEAGIGKTELLRRFCDEQRNAARILWGACDPLFTPRPLGALIDVATATGGQLEALVQSDPKPYEVAAALLDELGRSAPTVLVIEDLHWADEATLDVVRLLGRRVERVPALVLVSYRDELDRAHPLRVLTGELSTSASVRRLSVDALSPEAVAGLAEPKGVDAEELYRTTGGNPFFVTEVLAAGDAEIPATVRDAVFARAARLDPEARALLEAVAIVPPHGEPWLLEALAPEAIGHMDGCLTSGMLSTDQMGVAFRHELARMAVEDALPPDRRTALHRKALDALANPPVGEPDLTRLAHHAEGSADADAVLRFAPDAAALAASLGAHRESAAQYARAIRFGDQLDPRERARLLDRRAVECFLTDENTEAIEAQRLALDLYRELGDRRLEGDALRSLSTFLWCPGRIAESHQAGRDAVAVLEALPPGRELAMAYDNLAGFDESVMWARRAMELAEQIGETEIAVHALITLGFAEAMDGIPTGIGKLTRGIDAAEDAALPEQVGLGYDLLTLAYVHTRSHALANDAIARGLEYADEHGLELYRLYLLAYRARSRLDQGRWEEAADDAAKVVSVPRASTMPRTLAQIVLGLVRARRGDPGQWPPLDEAWSLAESTGEELRVGPAAAARAEAAWLEGDHGAVAEATDEALGLAVRSVRPWTVGELAYWRWRAGIQEEVPGAAAPYAVQIAGDPRRAVELWNDLGCPYEAALALADVDEEAPLRQALEILQDLGARPAASIVARRLRVRGVKGVARGPRPATQRNPSGLTAREVEVLALMVQGLRNAEIAERLVVSVKTVDHHVSAILRKLGVQTRGQASAEAMRLGLAGQDR